MFNLIIFIFLVSFFGFSILRLINIKTNSISSISLMFPFGSVLITFYCWALTILRIEYTFSNVYYPLIAICLFFLLASLFLNKKKEEEQFRFKGGNFSLSSNILFLFIFITTIIFFTYYIAHSISVRVYQPDEFSQWAFQAKMIYSGHSLESFYGGDQVGFETGFEMYPSFIPLLASSFYLFSGQVIDSFVRVIGPLFLGSLLLYMYSKLQAILYNKLLSILLLGVFISSGYVLFEMSTGLYADIEYTFFYTVSVCSLLQYIINKKDLKYLIGSSLFMALAAWCKTDGQYISMFHLLLIALFGYELIKEKKYLKMAGHLALYLVISISIPVLWKVYTVTRHFPASRWVFDPHPEYIFSMLTSSVNQIFNTNSWGFVWILVICFFIINLYVGINKKQLFFILVIIFNIFFLYVSYLLFFGVEAQTAASFSRYILRLAPISLIYTAMVIDSIEKTKFKI